MPALPGIATDSGTMKYAPLADDSYSPSPVLSRIMPPTAGKRITSTSSSVSSDSYTSNGYASTERQVYSGHNSGSEETLSATIMNNGQGKAREIEDEGDVGDYREKERERERKGKMKAEGQGNGRKPWDEEQGRVEELYGNTGAYPPTNEEEAEERKIQDNLARMAARDMARRRASRLSRQISTSPSNTPDPNEGGGFSSSTSFGRRPLSGLSLGSTGSNGSKRGSIMGLMEGIWPRSAGGNKGLERIDDTGELPLTQSHSRVSSNNPDPHPSPNLQPYTNPYDANARSMHPPLSPSSARSPFADPDPSDQAQNARTHGRQASTASEQGFSYSGPGWRGGAAVAGAGAAVAAGGAGMMVANGYQGEQKEKWWHALCAWGSDLDGGHGEDGDGQAGRTNPME